MVFIASIWMRGGCVMLRSSFYHFLLRRSFYEASDNFSFSSEMVSRKLAFSAYGMTSAVHSFNFYRKYIRYVICPPSFPLSFSKKKLKARQILKNSFFFFGFQVSIFIDFISIFIDFVFVFIIHFMRHLSSE